MYTCKKNAYTYLNEPTRTSTVYTLHEEWASQG